MTDWTTCRVVRDRDERLWMRYGTRSWESEDPGEPDTNTARLGSNYGTLTPVLDADGQPVVHTVGDLTARHIGKRVRVQRFEGVLSGIFATSVRTISLHIDDDAGALWIVSPESELTLDTPCEVLP